MTDNVFFLRNEKPLSTLALITFILAFIVILLGAYTRLTDAGLSCPDWPHCYGYLTAPHTAQQLEDAVKQYPLAPVDVKKAWTEMIHRYFAGAEGLLILIFTFFLIRQKVENKKSNYIAAMLITLLCIQVGLGMLTVTEKLKPIIVLSHLITGLSLLSVLWWAYLHLRFRDTYPSHKIRSQNHAPKLSLFWIALFLIVAQITLGGWVSTHYAGLACVDFPYCNGQLIPPLKWNQFNTDLVTIHMLHRIGALIVATYLSLFAIYLFTLKHFRTIAIGIFVLVGVQLVLGVINIIALRPVMIALSHQSVAILLLLTMIYALIKAYSTPKDITL